MSAQASQHRGTHESITAAIRGASAKPALIAYVTAGFPDKASFRSQLLAVADAADVVEVGVPFTDPMADGTTIQRSSRRALEHGVSLRWILNELAEMNPRPKAPVLLMSYLNPLLAFGLDKLPQAAARAGVSGFIIPDLPYEECEDMRDALAALGIALVQFVTPVSPDERMQQLTRASSGFVYAVTMTGTTGKNVDAPQETLDYFARARKLSPLPVCAGFGIRGPEQIRKLAPYVDGVIVGSALVEVIERGEDPAAFLRSLRS
jgi:tryptophan synthase alpha chain